MTAGRVSDASANDAAKVDGKLRLKDVDEEDIKLEDLAPDGGFGWMVALAMIVVYITVIGPSASFGIIFGDFVEATGQAGAATTLFNSVFMITFSIAGLMTNSLTKKYSMRPVGVIGATIFALPNVALAFVTSVYEMAFIYFLQGAGLGLVFTICNANFNSYFVKRRAQVMSASQVIIGFGGIAYPGIIEVMMKAYGFRGTALLTGALSLNCIVAMMLMHPMEWHAKDPSEIRAERIRDNEETEYRPLAIAHRRSLIDDTLIRGASKTTKWCSLRSLKEENAKKAPLLIGDVKAPGGSVASISQLEKPKARFGSWHEPLSNKLSTMSSSSLANIFAGISTYGEVRQIRHEKGAYTDKDQQEEETEFFAESAGFLEMSLLRNKTFLNMCLGTNFVLCSDFTFSSLLPIMMTNVGYNKSDAAWAIMIGASAELGSRILLAVFTMLVDVKAKYLFFFAMIAMAFAKIGFLYLENTLIGCFVMIAVIGAIRSWLIVPQPLVIIENMSVEKFASVYGINAVISGIISTVFGPIAGFVKDWTNSFAICQYLLIAMNLLFVVPWAVNFLFVDLSKKRAKAEATDRPIDAHSIP